jgi:hypothetical protein
VYVPDPPVADALKLIGEPGAAELGFALTVTLRGVWVKTAINRVSVVCPSTIVNVRSFCWVILNE